MLNMVHRLRLLILMCLLGALATKAAAAGAGGACANPQTDLGVERIVEIDTKSGPLYGAISLLEKEDSFLGPKEVVLTFDDGPLPEVTNSILDTLDQFCTKATFFSVGRMALAYPRTLKDILRRGHTLGGHSWSHPLNLKRMKFEKAVEQIENGFAAISVSTGGAVAPFFRFPGLSDSNKLLHHLQERGIATFTVDVVSDDSFIRNWRHLVSLTVNRIEQRQGGIVLFHDIKSVTKKALPHILKTLKKRGYKVVHLRAKRGLQPKPEAQALMQKRFDNKHNKKKKIAALNMPFVGMPAPQRFTAVIGAGPPVETLSPAPKARGVMRAETIPIPDRKPETEKEYK
ncbi:MAG: polysaccharide deacetylase family protein [Hyphomicrobiaceae bacterium]